MPLLEQPTNASTLDTSSINFSEILTPLESNSNTQLGATPQPQQTQSSFDTSNVDWSQILEPSQEVKDNQSVKNFVEEDYLNLAEATRSGQKPNEIWENLNLFKATGISFADVMQDKGSALIHSYNQALQGNLDEMRDIIKKSPSMQEFLTLRSPAEGVAVSTDKPLWNMEKVQRGLFSDMSNSWDVGEYQQERSKLLFKDWSGGATEDDQERILMLDERMDLVQRLRKDEGTVDFVERSFIGFLPQLVDLGENIALRGTQMAIPAAATGYLVGQTGGAIAGSVVPGAGTAVGAVGGGALGAISYGTLGFSAGATYGVAEHSYMMSVSEIWGAIRNLKDDYGNTIDPTTARTIAGAVAIPMAGLDLIGIGKIKKAMPFLDNFLNKQAIATVTKLLKNNPSLNGAMSEALKKIGVATGTEVITEALQERVLISAEEYAKTTNHMDIPAITDDEIDKRMLNAGKQAFATILIPALGGGALRAVRNRKIQQAQASENTLKQLHEDATKSETVKHAPELAGEYLKFLGDKEEGISDIYIRPEAIQRVFFQTEEGIATAKKLGITPEKVLESLTLDTDIAIPMESALTHIIGNEDVYNALSSDMRTQPDIMTPREAGKFTTSNKAESSYTETEVNTFLESIFEGLDESIAKNEERSATARPYVEQLVEAGYTKSQAKHLISPFLANAEILSPMFNQTPQEYLNQRFSGFNLTTQHLAKMTQADFERNTMRQISRTKLSERDPLLASIWGRVDPTSIKQYDSYALQELTKDYGRGLFSGKKKQGVSLDLLADELVRSGLLKEGDGAKELLGILQNRNQKKFLQAEQENKARGSIDFSNPQAVINLFKGKKNLSTVIHEGGHFFLENLREASQLENAPSWVQESWNTLQKEYGFEGDILSEAVHERFARDFEIYARNGEAPSPYLQSAFRQFSHWLTRLYKSIRSVIGREEISSDIQGVFDRLLATEQEIEESRQQGSPTFSLNDMESKGLAISPELKDRYARAVAKAHNKASAIIEVRRLVEQKEVERKARVEAKERIEKDSFYLAEQDIREKGGIHWESVLEHLDEDFAEELRRKWTSPFTKGFFKKNGSIDFYNAVSSFSVDSPHSLAGLLLSKPTRLEAIASEVQKAINEWNASFEGSIEYSSAMDSALALEIEALTGKKQISGTAIRQEIDRTMGVKKAATIEAEYKALKESLRKQESILRTIMNDVKRDTKKELQAIKKKATSDGVLAGEMHEGAKRAKERAKWQDRVANIKQKERATRVALSSAYFTRLEKDKLTRQIKTSVKSKSIHDDFKQQILAIVSHWRGLGTPTMSPRDVAGMPLLSDFIAQHESLFGEQQSIFPEWILEEGNDTGVKSHKDLSLEQLRDVKRTVDILAYKGRTHNKFLSFGKNVALTEATGEMIASMDKMLGKKYLSEQDRAKIQGKATGFLRGLVTPLTSMRYFFNEADGYVNKGGKDSKRGAHDRYIMSGLQEAMGKELHLQREYTEKLVPSLMKLKRKSENKGITFVDNMRTGFKIEGVRLPDDIAQEWGSLFTHEKVLAVALNMGNEGNINAIKRGYGWSDAELQRIVSRLTVKELNAIQEIWDSINDLYPVLNETHQKMNGVPLAKVEAKPITLQASDGSVTLRGGYYPLVFDHMLSRKAEEQQSTDMLINRNENLVRRPNPKSGMTKERKGGTLPPKLSLGVIQEHVADTIHYATHAPVLRDIYSIIQLPEYRKAFIRAIGINAYNEITPWLRSIARPEAQALSTYSKIAESLAKRGSQFVMAMNMKSAFLQLTSFGNSVTEVGAGHFARGMYQLVSRRQTLIQEVRAKSAYMQSREHLLDASLKEWIGEFSLQGSKSFEVMGKRFTLEQVRNSQYAVIQALDAAISYPTWIASYDKSIASGIKEHEAIILADEAVMRSQGNGGKIDTPRILRERGFIKLATTFMTFALNEFNRKKYYIKGGLERLRGGNSQIDFKTFASHVALEWITPVVLTTWLVSLGRDGEIPETEDYAWETSGMLSMGIPIGRDIVHGVEYNMRGGKSGNMGDSVGYIGIERTLDALGYGRKYAEDGKEKDRDRAINAFIDAVGFMRGFGTMNIRKMDRGTEAFLNGEGGIFNIFLGPPEKKKKKNKY